MKKFILVILFFCMRGGAWGNEVPPPMVRVASNGHWFTFLCNGSSGSSNIVVSKSDLPDSSEIVVFHKNLEDDEDCSQGAWIADPEDSNPRLVTINPGNGGVNAEMLVFIIDSNSVNFSGYLPVAATRVSPSEFNFDVDDDSGNGVWRQIYNIKENKITKSMDFLKMHAGLICIDRNGDVGDFQVFGSTPCAWKTLHATKGSPLCISYKNGKGRLMDEKFCQGIN